MLHIPNGKTTPCCLFPNSKQHISEISPRMAHIIFKLQLIIIVQPKKEKKKTVTFMATWPERHKYHQSFSVEILHCTGNPTSNSLSHNLLTYKPSKDTTFVCCPYNGSTRDKWPASGTSKQPHIAGGHYVLGSYTDQDDSVADVLDVKTKRKDDTMGCTTGCCRDKL